MALQRTPWRFTVADYHRMAEAGILGEDDRVELIEGEIIRMSPIGREHAGCVKYLTNVLGQGIDAAAIVAVQDPLVLGDHSEPEPDLMILRRRPDYYRSGHPTPADVLLIVEVADTSLEYDRQVKVPLYARDGIPETWLLNLAQEHIVVYRDPGAEGYRSVRVARRGETISPLACPDLSLAVADVLG